MNPAYSIPSGVTRTKHQSHPALITDQGGKIILDDWTAGLWGQADGNSLENLVMSSSESQALLIRSALACLVEAGVLERDWSITETPADITIDGPLVSVIIVSYNSLDWLADCLASIASQEYGPLELIIVDNASQDRTIPWLRASYADEITLLELKQPHSLADALNHGVAAAHGEYYLLLNPDTTLAAGAISHLVSTAGKAPKPAAVAAKLKFMSAPAFLNGLGNSVGAVGWGTDSALGYLDLGQFDHWDEVPSACFAATLILRKSWEEIGPLDDGLPMYYEDSEWCYRARLFGYQVHAAPQAVVYHAFSGRALGEAVAMSAQKTHHVVYGRLRFVSRILSKGSCRRFLVNYALEDFIRFISALLHGRWPVLRAYIRAWNEWNKSRPDLDKQRGCIQDRRVISDAQLLDLQRDVPEPLVRYGLPQLTRDIILNHYLPAMLAGGTHPMPEFAGLPESAFAPPNLWRRACQIQRYEGTRALVHRLGKIFQRRLARL